LIVYNYYENKEADYAIHDTADNGLFIIGILVLILKGNTI